MSYFSKKVLESIFFLFLLLSLVSAQDSPKVEVKYLEKKIADACKRYSYIYKLNPYFVLAIISAESDFSQLAISNVGAGGIAQLMPETAEILGMKKVFKPDYYKEAQIKWKKSHRHYSKAIMYLKKLDGKNALKEMKAYKKLRKKAQKLFSLYKEKLLSKIEGKSEKELEKIDQRFIVDLAIDKTVNHIAHLAKSRNGDLREVASAYNAGSGAVKVAGGIPFIKQTVIFQNRVINRYKKFKK